MKGKFYETMLIVRPSPRTAAKLLAGWLVTKVLLCCPMADAVLQEYLDSVSPASINSLTAPDSQQSVHYAATKSIIQCVKI